MGKSAMTPREPPFARLACFAKKLISGCGGGDITYFGDLSKRLLGRKGGGVQHRL